MEEQLDKPHLLTLMDTGYTEFTTLAWTKGTPLYAWVAGNTFGHYKEHIVPIQSWLVSQS